MGIKRKFQDWFEEQQDLGERCGVSLGWAQEELMEAAWNASRKALLCESPTAEVVSKYGDPESFGERELIAIGDIQKLPYGTKLYALENTPDGN